VSRPECSLSRQATLRSGEKLLPWPTVAARGIALLLALLAIALAFASDDVPGLTVSRSSHDAPGTDEMHMQE
jgi:hypothetical protein